jgi:hypothetical protein
VKIDGTMPEAAELLVRTRPVKRPPVLSVTGTMCVILLALAGWTAHFAGPPATVVLTVFGGIFGLLFLLFLIASRLTRVPDPVFAANRAGVWFGVAGTSRRPWAIELPWTDISQIRTAMLWPDVGPGLRHLCFDAYELDVEALLSAEVGTRRPYREFRTPFALYLPGLDTPPEEVIRMLRDLAPGHVTFDLRAGERV